MVWHPSSLVPGAAPSRPFEYGIMMRPEWKQMS